MKQYHELLQKILDQGIASQDRTGTGTLSLFGQQMTFDLTQGFPLLTTKKVSFKNIATELIWMLRGSTKIDYLKENNNTIWDEWVINDELPHTYPKQWRAFSSPDSQYKVDQMRLLIDGLISNPYSRRHLVVAYNPLDAHLSALPACHSFFQMFVRDNKLSCLFYMRSNDFFLGNPYNIASYALLTHIIANICGYTANELIYTCGDCHLYQNHIKQAKELLSRDYNRYELPSLRVSSSDIDNISLDQFVLSNYKSYPSINAEVSV